jgi:hypothetical protein
LPREERRGDHGDNNKGVVQNYERERERERERDREREKKRRESRVRKRVRTPRHIAMSRAHHFWLLLSSPVSVIFFHYFRINPLQRMEERGGYVWGWKRTK